MQEFLPIWRTLDGKTTQIWWLANMEYNTFKVVVVVFLLLSFDVFVPTSAHPLVFLDKCFV